MMQNQAQTETFYGLGIVPKILEVLARLKFTKPTPIQFKAIPSAIDRKDVIGVAQTGTGKTLAFCVPMIQHLIQKRGRGLVLVPTRELAIQVNETFHKVGVSMGIHTAVLIGGASMYHQIQSLRRHPQVIIATPGRLIDHLERRTVFLNNVDTLVLDEADRMLDMGFAPQIETVLKTVPKERQTMLFSATMAHEIMSIATRYMKLPLRIEVAPSGSVAERVTQEVFIVRRDAKDKLLFKLLEQYKGTVLIFSQTKIGARRISRFLRNMNLSAAEIHSDRTLAQRREALEGFKSGKYRILVATDIAARGIDVVGIELVVNYDIPEDPQNYVHRIGRTARAGQKGHAISLATPDQGDDVRSIEKLIRGNLPIAQHPEFPSESFYGARGPHAPGQRPISQRGSSWGSRRGGFARKRSFYPRGR